MCDLKTYAVRYCDAHLDTRDNEAALQSHWNGKGQSENRNCAPDPNIWDPVAYADRYPDLKAAFGTDANALWRHYVNNGSIEMRYPGRDPTMAAWPSTACYAHWRPTQAYGLGAAPTATTAGVLTKLNELKQKKQELDNFKNNTAAVCQCSLLQPTGHKWS